MKPIKYVFVGLLFCGCAQKNDSKNVDATVLEGDTWVSDCNYVASNQYLLESVSFSSGTYRAVLTLHLNSSCSNGIMDIVQVGSYSVGNPASGVAATEIDMTLQKISFKPLQWSLANQYNSLIYCGLSAWAPNVEADVTGKTCGTSTMPSRGKMTYDVYSISSQGMRMGGNDGVHDASTPSNRPVILSTTVYTKQ